MVAVTDFIIENGYFDIVTWIWIAIALVTYLYLFKQPAPYGRHTTKGWGPEIPSYIGWILMEAPSPLILALCFYVAPPPTSAIGSWILLGLWLIHYVHRTLIQPLTNPGGNKPMPLLICMSAIGFNIVNGYVNGRALTLYHHGNEWLTAPTTIIGLFIFVVGFFVNR